MALLSISSYFEMIHTREGRRWSFKSKSVSTCETSNLAGMDLVLLGVDGGVLMWCDISTNMAAASFTEILSLTSAGWPSDNSGGGGPRSRPEIAAATTGRGSEICDIADVMRACVVVVVGSGSGDVALERGACARLSGGCRDFVEKSRGSSCGGVTCSSTSSWRNFRFMLKSRISFSSS